MYSTSVDYLQNRVSAVELECRTEDCLDSSVCMSVVEKILEDDSEKFKPNLQNSHEYDFKNMNSVNNDVNFSYINSMQPQNWEKNLFGEPSFIPISYFDHPSLNNLMSPQGCGNEYIIQPIEDFQDRYQLPIGSHLKENYKVCTPERIQYSETSNVVPSWKEAKMYHSEGKISERYPKTPMKNNERSNYHVYNANKDNYGMIEDFDDDMKGSLQLSVFFTNFIKKERMKTEQEFASLKISSNNSYPIPRLPRSPSTIDHLIIMEMKEYSKVITLVAKVESLYKFRFCADVQKSLQQWLEKIKQLKAGRELKIMLNDPNKMTKYTMELSSVCKRAMTLLWCAFTIFFGCSEHKIYLEELMHLIDDGKGDNYIQEWMEIQKFSKFN